MIKTNITNFENHVSDYIDQVIKNNDIISISTEIGNAIILSEEDFNGIMETLYLSGNPQVKADILEGMNTPLDECVSEDDIEW